MNTPLIDEDVAVPERQLLNSMPADEDKVRESLELLRAIQFGKSDDVLGSVREQEQLSINWSAFEKAALKPTPFEKLQKLRFTWRNVGLEAGIATLMPLCAYLVSSWSIRQAIYHQNFSWSVASIAITIGAVGVSLLAVYLVLGERIRTRTTALPTTARVLKYVPMAAALGGILVGLFSLLPSNDHDDWTEIAIVNSIETETRYISSSQIRHTETLAACKAFVDANWFENLTELLDNNDANSLNLLGVCMEKQERFSDAQVAYTVAGYLDEGNPHILFNSDTNFASKKLLNDLLDGKLIKLDKPETDESILFRNDYAELVDQLKNGGFEVERFSAKTPEDFCFLGGAYEYQGKDNLAIDCYKKAIDLDRKNSIGLARFKQLFSAKIDLRNEDGVVSIVKDEELTQPGDGNF